MMQKILHFLRPHMSFFCAALVAVFTVGVYLPALGNDFVNWDDMLYVYENPRIRSLDISFLRWAFFDFHVSNWHPLTWVSHAVDYAFWGLDPAGHHFTSILLHGLNSGILVILVMQLLGAARGTAAGADEGQGVLSRGSMLAAAFVTGLLFGIHPLHVESVAWISERKDVLCAFFFAGSLIAYLRYATSEAPGAGRGAGLPPYSDRRYLASLASFVLALLSKPMAVTVPVVLLIMDWYPLGRFGEGKMKPLVIEKIPYAALGLLSSFLTLKAQHSTESVISMTDVSLLVRVLMASKALILYLVKMLLPTGLSPFYPYPRTLPLLSPGYLLPAAAVILITAGCVAVSRKKRFYLAIWGYYVVTLLPVLGVVQVGSQAMADRYTYLPSIGPFLLVGVGAASLLNPLKSSLLWRRRGAIALSVFCVAWIGVLAFVTVKQISIWKNGVVLWSRVIAINPGVPMAYARRADAYAAQGRFEDSLRDYTQALSLGLTQFNSDVSSYYSGRGTIYAKAGNYPEALRDFNGAIWTSLRPTFDNYYNRGYVHEKLGRYEEALQDYTQAAYLNPDAYELYNNRGYVYEKLGQLKSAEADYTRAIHLGGHSPLPHYNRGNVYLKMGRYDDAVRDYTEAIQLSPEPPADYYRGRASALEKAGRHEEALRDRETARRLGP